MGSSRDISDEVNALEFETEEDVGNPNYGANAAMGENVGNARDLTDYFNTPEAEWERQRQADESRANRRHAAINLATSFITKGNEEDLIKIAKRIDKFLEEGQ
jgi:hypothetical protein